MISSGSHGVLGRTVVLAGGTSTAGFATASALADAGARVVVTGRDAVKLVRAESLGPLIATAQADLTEEEDVYALADTLRKQFGPIDGLLHLVGGWRGGGGLAGQSESDFRFLERSLTALRHMSRAFDPDLSASSAGRTAIISSTAVVRPSAGGANYAAVKAASEAWVRAIGRGYASDARAAGREPTSSAAIFRVRALKGLELVLANAFVQLWEQPAAESGVSVVELDEAATGYEVYPAVRLVTLG
ncbi:SDR family NAD(P)-dependent oxidoreductase [Microbacterium sp. E-13]|uniref:SDR family NAD(P)-dependent oxidoreductase n=1 Tax=Microbacterium sp. E-13 TaxID=3404048 RepID=UPI003CE9F01A